MTFKHRENEAKLYFEEPLFLFLTRSKTSRYDTRGFFYGTKKKLRFSLLILFLSEFKEADDAANLLIGEFCPSCIERPVEDSCDANNLVGREPGAGEWDCKVSRRWEKMNRCRFMCDNGSITGYARCFRFEDHRKFLLGWVDPQNRPFTC